METTLVIVTGISLALALGLGALLWRLLRDERQRADARVAALVDGYAQRSAAEPASAGDADAAFEDDAVAFAATTATAGASRASGARHVEAEPVTAAPRAAFEQVDLSTDTDWLSHFPSASREQGATPPATPTPAPAARDSADTLRFERQDAPAFDFDLPRASDSARVLFGQVEEAERANEPNHLMTAGLVAALLVGLVLAIWTVSHLVITMTAAAQQPASASAAAGTSASTASTSAANASATAPLELLSLRHDQDSGTLTISGLVRNPPNAARQDRLTAVIFFFNQRGDFLTSVRAPLDFRTLAPGDESPFQVSAPAPAGVSRFRVSFRHDEGDVVPHVDRRQSPQG